MPNDTIGFAAPGYSTKRHALFFFIFWVKVSFHPFYPDNKSLKLILSGETRRKQALIDQPPESEIKKCQVGT